MSGDSDGRPVVKRSGDVEYETVDAAAGLRKGVLVGDDEGAPHFAMRRFVLEPGASVPKHTNEVEHEQYVLAGEYVVGVGEAAATAATGETVDGGVEYALEAGDSVLVPAGTVHWYRNDGDEPGAFICVVPNGDDEIRLVE